MPETVLVLGASGHFGHHAAAAFEAAGWEVRRFDRARDDLLERARGADLIVNAQNPPGYRGWDTAVPAITERALTAARAAGAAVLLPGNVYNFGDTPGTWDETTPHRPTTRKGRIRVEAERRYREAAEGGVRAIVLRAGDFIDPDQAGGWLDLVIAKDARRGRLAYPGDPTIPHAWAYLPDLARAAVALAEARDSLPRFADVPFPGHTLTGEQLAASLARALGRPLTVKRMPWLPLKLAAPFWTMGRELLEMRYLWDTPHALGDARFRALLPDFEATPIDEALARFARTVLAG